MNGTAVATASGTASGWRPAPARPLASHHPAMNRIAAPRKTDGIASRTPLRPSSKTDAWFQPLATVPARRSHGWIAWRLRIGAADEGDQLVAG